MRLRSFWISGAVTMIAALGAVVQAEVVATATQVRTFLGNATGKLVYTKLDCNDNSCNKRGRSLWYVDFSETVLTERQILSTSSDNAEPRNTVVSPDGQWIAYNTLNVDRTGDGSWLNIARIQQNVSSTIGKGGGALPHWWIKPGTSELYLIYNDRDLEESSGWMMSFPWDRASTEIVQVNSTTMANIGSAATLVSTLANGGRSKNGEWLFAAGGAPGTFRINATATSSTSLLETISLSLESGTSSWDTLDGCNPSMSPHSATDDIRVMYVSRDDPYNHRAVWICDVRGNNRRRVMWNNSENPYVDEPEWSNHELYAAAKASSELTTGPFDLYIFRVADGSHLKIIEGNYSFPYLWIDPSSIGVKPSGARGSYAAPARIAVSGQTVRVHSGSGTLRLIDVAGRIAASWQVSEGASITCEARPGRYVAELQSAGGVARSSVIVR